MKILIIISTTSSTKLIGKGMTNSKIPTIEATIMSLFG